MNNKSLAIIGVLVMIVVALGIYFYSKKSLPQMTDTTTKQTESTPTTSQTTPSDSESVSPTPDVTETPAGASVPTIFPNGLKVEDLKVGQGEAVKSGDQISIHYLGTLTNGTKFDSSYDRGQPFETQIGVGQVIQGWDLGVVGMRVNGKRKLTIPPELGYGERGAGAVIPPNATLIFEVELIGILE
ncbi:MAG: FKBP-type peptidyl-prolyl cis-trans isomerase [bacterium]|nr:FKBP-type peptidyl-prolyl cis-trans isomerase [bacterium]